LLQRLERAVQARELRLATRKIGGLLFELLGDKRDLRGERRTERGRFAVEPFAAQRERSERLIRVLAARLGDANRLLNLADLLLNLSQRARRRGKPGLGVGQRGLHGTLFFDSLLAAVYGSRELPLSVARLGRERRDL